MPELTRPFRVCVDYDEDRVRIYRVHAESLEAAEAIARGKVLDLLTIHADEDDEPYHWDDELGNERVALVHAEVHWRGADTGVSGYVLMARMSDGSLRTPSGHPQPFATEYLAWRIAHLLRFDDENGFLTIASTTA